MVTLMRHGPFQARRQALRAFDGPSVVDIITVGGSIRILEKIDGQSTVV
jgi:hypothetical protein